MSSQEPLQGPSAIVDDVVGEVLPDFDWQAVVRAYPLPALAVAAAIGFYLGRSQGSNVVASVADLATERLNEGVDRFLQTSR